VVEKTLSCLVDSAMDCVLLSPLNFVEQTKPKVPRLNSPPDLNRNGSLTFEN
jgi:hypothetical protein